MTMLTKWICCLAFTMALPLTALAAQQTETLKPGIRIRVTYFNARAVTEGIVGTLVSIDSASILFRRQNGWTVNLPRGLVRRVDVSAGPGICSPGHRATCVLVGFLGGTGLGLVVGRMTYSESCSDSYCLMYLITVPTGVLIGLIVGATIGNEHWNKAKFPVRLTLAPAVTGGLKPLRAVRVGGRLTF